MPLLASLNDHDCLGKLEDIVRARMDTAEARALAASFDSVDDVVAYIRAKPQRDDMGDPRDGPRIACDVSQRVRFWAPDPACLERTGDYLTLALLVDPDLELTSATMMLDNGLHTFPVEIRQGVPRAIVLDPLTTGLHNAMNATAYQLRNASPMGRDLIAPWFADLAYNAARTRDAEDCYHAAVAALRDALLTGQPMRDPEAIECVLGMAYEDAHLFGTPGVMAHERVARSVRNLGVAIDSKRLARFLNNLVDVAEPMAADLIKAALIAKFGPAAGIALQGVELGVANQNQGKRQLSPAPANPDQEDQHPDDKHSTDQQHTDHHDERAKRRASARRMTFAFRPTNKKGK